MNAKAADGGGQRPWQRARDPKVVWLALRVALLIGTALNLIHHFDLFLGVPMTSTVAIQLGLSYIVPYCVSTHGQVFGRRV